MSDRIQTATLADIYARQGHLERAIEIYQALLAEAPQDDRLRARLRAAEAQQRAAEHGGVDAARRLELLRTLLARVRSRRNRAQPSR